MKLLSSLLLASLMGMGAFWLVPGASFGSNVVNEKAASSEVSGVHLRALVVAYVEFEKRGLDVAHYSAKVTEEDDGFLVVFVPAHPFVPAVRGGRTAYGPELRYRISRDGTIRSVGFAR